MATTRVFKSGNSKAVRLPKSFDIAVGAEVRVSEELGRYVIEPVPAKTELFDVWSFYGAIPGAKPITDRTIDDRPSEIAARGRDAA